jgi:hypothetical protein
VGTCEAESCHDSIRIRDLFLNHPVRIGKRGTKLPENFLQAPEPRPLAWKRHLFDHVDMEIVVRGFDVATVQDTVEKLANSSGVHFQSVGS